MGMYGDGYGDGLYGDLPLDRVQWFFTSLPRKSVLNSVNRIFNFVRVCPNYKQEEICLHSPGFTSSILNKSNDYNVNLIYGNCL